MTSDKKNPEIGLYHKILSPDYPDWLDDYIATPEMQRIDKISMSCGTDYSGLYNNTYWYSNLDHSIGVALIVWNFTHDKKQTLAGLFHDIANPTFKHCIDFMNGDSEKQESTEERTTDIIKNSKDITSLLKRDRINVDEISDYKIYPIADNDTPQLAADRFEYNFSSGLVLKRVWNLEDIEDCYNDIIVGKNEKNIDELSFQNQAKCEKYIHFVSDLWPAWVEGKNRASMQFLADIVKNMNIVGYLTIDDLYTLSEKEIIDRIINCNNSYLSSRFQEFLDCKESYESDRPIENKYCTDVKSKKRYVIPLIKLDDSYVRINKVSVTACKEINNYLQKEWPEYAGLNIDFKPYIVPSI
jgi:hypothetical protein